MLKAAWKCGLLSLLLAGLLSGVVLTARSADLYHGGPGGPILVVTNSANPFSQYYAEILLAEGLNEFALTNITSVSAAALAKYDLVLLGEMTLSKAQVTTFSNWVNGGGNLIAMRPDKQLAGLLGLADAGRTLSERYLLVNTSNGPGAGIVGESMQFHGTADGYTAAGATVLAVLYSNAVTASAYPAVTWRSVGTNGGQAAAFTYDLARSVVYTRQGNPVWAGQERDGSSPIRPDDLFFGAKAGDVQPDWVDLNKVAIPQADEQQRLLANLILWLEAGKKLLPRFWYLPHGYKAAVAMTGDDHAGLNGGSYAPDRFDRYLAASVPGQSVDDWEVPRCTAYLFLSPDLSLSNNAEATAYQAAGFEMGLHLDTGCADYTAAGLTSLFTTQLNQFKAKYPGLPTPATHRFHCIAWSGYTFPAEVSLQFGIRLDTSYYYWPDSWVQDRPGLFTGSGLPMRFATTNGAVLDIYQAATQMTDESGQSYPETADTLLDRALGPEGYYGAFVANMHTDIDNEPAAQAVFTSAQARGVPIISARQLLTWVDARNQSCISNIVWSGGRETFSIVANPGARGLQAMAPIPLGYSVTNLTCNGVAVGYALQRVKGILYAVFAATNGNYAIGYAFDTTPPTIASVLPANGASQVSLSTALSIAFSESMSAATLNPNTVFLRDSANALVPASVSYDDSRFTVTLVPASPLAPGRSYTATVKGGSGGVSDLAGNFLAGDYVWAFRTEVPPVYCFGNTNNGTLSDTIWGNSPCINASRFQATTNVSVSLMRAKVTAMAGRYKCAIYTDSSSRPSRLLGSTLEVSNPSDGWQTFPLTSPVTLTRGNYYWLAVWSDDANARMYYSNSGGTLRWQNYSYGAWPDPITTTGAGSYNYCIYAFVPGGPAATNLAATVLEDTSTNLTLSGSTPGGTVSFGLLTGPTNGVLGTLNPGTGAVSYTPNRDYFGPDSFQFSVNDGSLRATGTVNLTILAVNDAPTLLLASNNVVVPENCGAVSLPGFAATTVGPVNESGQSITNIGLLSVTNAALFAAGPAFSTAGTLTFTPAAGRYGMAAVTVLARDNGGTANGGTNRSDAQTFTITVTQVNRRPVASNDNYDLGGGVTLDMSPPGILANDTDPDGDSLTVLLVSGAQQGTLSLTPTGGFRYSPTNHFDGVDTFTYQASDGLTNSSPATVAITVSNRIKIIAITPLDDVVTVDWSSIAGKTYRLQYKSSLTDADWQSVSPDVSATGPTTTVTNVIGTEATRFYRVLCPGK